MELIIVIVVLFFLFVFFASDETHEAIFELANSAATRTEADEVLKKLKVAKSIEDKLEIVKSIKMCTSIELLTEENNVAKANAYP